MARLARVEVFSPDEIAVVHVMNRVVRRCFLMGIDPVTGKNYDHRKVWIESELKRLAASFGIDLIAFSILDNHFHLVLRSRPDVVKTWDDTEVAGRWVMLCPVRKHADGSAKKPSEPELNSIRYDSAKLREIRSRLSDISWWMRLLCQRIAQWANVEDESEGKFWQNRYRSVRLLDEESILACAVYVELNLIRAALAETLETSNHTSVQRRIESVRHSIDNLAGDDSSYPSKDVSDLAATACPGNDCARVVARPDDFLSPVSIDELRDALGARPNMTGTRCSDKGFISMTEMEYLELLDWTARRVAPGKSGSTANDAPVLLERLNINPKTWVELVTRFGQLFSVVAGRPHIVETTRSRLRGCRYHVRREARQLLSA